MLDKSADPLQSTLQVDDEAQVTEVHECTQDPIFDDDGRTPLGGEKERTKRAKGPYLAC